jgi:CRP-like cAMP-binding protein
MELTEYLQLNSSVNKAVLEDTVLKFTRHHLDTDRYLIRKGNFADSYYYIESGNIRSYFIDKDKERTVWIHSPEELFCEIKSLRLKIPTEFYFQAMEPVTYLSIKAIDFDKLVAEDKNLQRYMMQFWESRFIVALDANRVFQTMNAKQRYDFFVRNFPRFKELPLQHLATLIGITQSSLSRIRRMN